MFSHCMYLKCTSNCRIPEHSFIFVYINIFNQPYQLRNTLVGSRTDWNILKKMSVEVLSDRPSAKGSKKMGKTPKQRFLQICISKSIDLSGNIKTTRMFPVKYPIE